MTMVSIKKSLFAIEAFNPKGNLYLQVAGQGSEQHLIVVQKNWFGRLLMWLGCGNACMKKVARYIADNVDALCQNATEGRKENLKTLFERIEKYDDRHSHKISSLVFKIKQVIHKFVFGINFTPLTITPIPPATIPSPTKSALIPPKTPAILVNMAPPSPVQSSKLQSVVEFEKCRNDRRAVFDLLGKYGQDEGQFKALMEAMTPQEIYSFSPAQQTEINDFFDLAACKMTRIKPDFVFRFMSPQQLQELIRGHFIQQWQNGIEESFSNVIKNILAHRPQIEQIQLIDQIVQSEIFTFNCMTREDTPDQNILKSRYLLHVLQEPDQAIRKTKLQEFLVTIWELNTPPPTTSFLCDPNFVRLLTIEQKGEIALTLISEFRLSTWENLSLIPELMKDRTWAPQLLNKTLLSEFLHLLNLCDNVEILQTFALANPAHISLSTVYEKMLDLLLDSQPIQDDPITEVIDKVVSYFKQSLDMDFIQSIQTLFIHSQKQQALASFLLRKYTISDWSNWAEVNGQSGGGKSIWVHSQSLFMAVNNDVQKTAALVNLCKDPQDLICLMTVYPLLKKDRVYDKKCLACLTTGIEKLLIGPMAKEIETLFLLLKKLDDVRCIVQFYTNKTQLREVHTFLKTQPKYNTKFLECIEERIQAL